MITKLPWWDNHDAESFVNAIQRTLDMREHPYMSIFRRRLEIVTVLMSNKIEQTIPAGFDDSSTQAILEQIQNDPSLSPGDVPWPAEGSMTPECMRQQLFQHAQALFHVIQLAYDGVPLTANTICDVHSILMHNAIDIEPGVYRKTAAHNGAGYVYAEHTAIKSSLQELCIWLNGHVQTTHEIHDQCKVAANFMHRLLVIHPFTNGNGRLARLLTNYAFLMMGAPFLIPLSDGHRKARKHYITCILNESRGKKGYLASHLLECYANACNNFQAIYHP